MCSGMNLYMHNLHRPIASSQSYLVKALYAFEISVGLAHRFDNNIFHTDQHLSCQPKLY